MPTPPKNLRDFSSLVKVVEDLRGPQGCPWDKEQTNRSLTPYALEEACELAEAIEGGQTPEIIGELGDLLLQVVLHAEILKNDNLGDISDVIEGINSKMIRRHPHVFADTQVEGSDEVLSNWEDIKKQERLKENKAELRPGEFEVPKGIPALQRSSKIGKKTTKTGFDWSHWSQVIEKVDEELVEVKESIANFENQKSDEQLSHVEDEIGDLLFAISQLARHLKIDPEQALRKTNKRFESRYKKMIDFCEEDNKNFTELSVEQKEELWRKAKKSLS